MNPSARQRNKLARTLKRFAFEENPMFRQNKIQEMSVTREFVFWDQPELPEELEAKIMRDRVVIELGFRAIRVRQVDGLRPLYYYDSSIYAARSIAPRELSARLSQNTLDNLYLDFCNDDVNFDEEDMSDIAKQLRIQRRDEVIDELHEHGVECLAYHLESLRFGSGERSIDSRYEHGYKIDGRVYDDISSDEPFEHDDYEKVQTPQGTEWIQKRPQGVDGSPSVYAVESIAEDEEFNAIVEGIVDEQLSDDLFSYDDKRKQVLHVIECLRKKLST